jgi:hypothetical protein
MKYGFYHPKRGYWQANSDVPQHIRDGYPSGTVEVPLRPVGNFDWDGVKWVELPPDIEALSADAKAKRNALLQRSDWTQIAQTSRRSLGFLSKSTGQRLHNETDKGSQPGVLLQWDTANEQ